MKFFSVIVSCLSLFAASNSVYAQNYSVYDATGGQNNGGDSVSVDGGAGPILANRFVTSDASELQSVVLNLESNPGSSGSFTVDLFSDTGANGPGTDTQIAFVQDASLSSSFQLETYTVGTTLFLAANTSYYIGIMNNDGSSATLGNTIDGEILGRNSVLTGASYFNNSGVQANSGGPYEIQVNVAGVPEPTSWAFLLVGMGAIGTACRAQRKKVKVCSL